MRKRIGAALLALLVSAGIIVGVQAPAQAAYTCAVGNICFYSNAGGSGLILAYYAPNVPYMIPNTGMPSGWNDIVSSVFNNSSKRFVLCKHNPCGTLSSNMMVMHAGTLISWCGGCSWNDAISAFFRDSA
jgi:hypothetical protein